jgi:hypothetical protein
VYFFLIPTVEVAGVTSPLDPAPESLLTATGVLPLETDTSTAASLPTTPQRFQPSRATPPLTPKQLTAVLLAEAAQATISLLHRMGLLTAPADDPLARTATTEPTRDPLRP